MSVNLEKLALHQVKNELGPSHDLSSDKMLMETVTQSLLGFQSSFSGKISSVEHLSSHTPSRTAVDKQSLKRHMSCGKIVTLTIAPTKIQDKANGMQAKHAERIERSCETIPALFPQRSAMQKSQ